MYIEYFYFFILGELNDITETTNISELIKLKIKVPLMANVILEYTQNGVIDEHLVNVISAIVDSLKQQRDKIRLPDDNQYGQLIENPLDFYPNFPRLIAHADYDADRESVAKSEVRECRKKTQSHPTLLPGLFTVFCECGVCLGFSLMTEVESPKTPFQIFLTRFSKYLKQLIIIYDNGCNLLEYILRREPARFWDTDIFVDRLHMRDHKACSRGFDLNMYKANPHINTLNSQANEQANADLRNLSKQVTYMRPEQVIHHTSLFLAERNRKKKMMAPTPDF